MLSTVLAWIISGLFLGVVVFFCLIFPLFVLMHVFRNPALSGGRKVLWAVFIGMTWMIGASVYSLFMSGRTLYRLCALCTLVLVGLIWVLQGPIQRFQEKQKLHTPAIRQLTAAGEWDHLKPILVAYDMKAFAQHIEGGFCQEAQKDLAKNLSHFIKSGAKLNANASEIKKLGAKALDLCEKMK